MSNDEEPLKGQFRFFLNQLGSNLITSLFLAVWVAMQWGVNYLVNLFELSQFDLMWMWIFQGIFGLTSLSPILLYYYEDIRIAWIRTQKRINKAKGTTRR